MGYVYLARILTLEDAQKLEDAISGKLGVIGKIVDPNKVYPSTVAVNPNLNGKTQEQVDAILENQEKTERVNSYCFYATDIDTCIENLKILAMQPMSEGAVDRINNDEYDAEDCFAGDRPAMCVLRIPDVLFAKWCEYGMAGVGEGDYEYQWEKVQLPEVIIGDEAMREAIANNAIFMYDEIHKVFDGLGSDFDSANIFGNNFKAIGAINRAQELFKGMEDENTNEIVSAASEITERTQLLVDTMKKWASGKKEKVLDALSNKEAQAEIVPEITPVQNKEFENPYRPGTEPYEAYEQIVNNPKFSSKTKHTMIKLLDRSNEGNNNVYLEGDNLPNS